MVRRFMPSDLDRLMEIWLEGNLQAHPFVDAAYWQENFEPVRQMLPQADIYVYEDSGKILGFIGIMGDYIAGIFVDSSARSKGAGRQLCDFAKQSHTELNLNVYRKNEGAVRFYRREGFAVENEGIDEATGQAELLMRWRACQAMD